MSKQTNLLSFFAKRPSPPTVKSEQTTINPNQTLIKEEENQTSLINRPAQMFSDDEITLPKKRPRRSIDSPDTRISLPRSPSPARRSSLPSPPRRSSLDSLALESRQSLPARFSLGSNAGPGVGAKGAGTKVTLEDRSFMQSLVKDSHYWWQFIDAYYEGIALGFEFPAFLDPQKLRDGKGRRPEDVDFDETTLAIDGGAARGVKAEKAETFTPMHAQYWKVKSGGHMNEILLFKVGKFYEIFYTDAVIAQKALGLKWMGGGSAAANRAHVGFPEVSLETQAKALVEATGLPVAVVEQTETVAEANERTGKATGALVQRDVCEVFTEALVDDGKILAVVSSASISGTAGRMTDEHSYAVCVGDCGQGKFHFGEVSDLRNLIAQIQPREVLVSPSLAGELAKLTRPLGGRVRLIKWREWGAKSQQPGQEAKQGMTAYLHRLKLSALAASAEWLPLDTSDAQLARHLVLDAAAIMQLDLLRTRSDRVSEGSFEEFMTEGCVSAFGKRMMRRWLLAPLRQKTDIEERQAKVAEYVAHARERAQIREKLRKLPDLEKSVQKVCTWGQTKNRQAVFFTDVESKRLGFFVDTVAALKRACDVGNTTAGREVRELCERLGRRVVKKDDAQFEPTEEWKDWMEILAEERQIENILNKELDKLKTELNENNCKFVHNKYKYEVEVPERRSLDYEVTSHRKGFVRFQTDNIRKYVARLELLEQRKKDALYPFMADLFADFACHRNVFGKLVDELAELDCILTLAVISGNRDYVKPLISDEGEGLFALEAGRHPILELRGAFVSNDVTLKQSTPLLLTGPNMGGKSTVLRMTALITIMAQMGCYVPAKAFRLSPVDRLFTRIGARDAILEGKSTFLVELEEAAAFLNNGTTSSLALIDELGRGTSTHDGAAIAGATIDFVASEIKCRCIFSTHYDFHVAEAENFRMAYKIYDDRVHFQYKLEPGRAESSQAINVARLAGLPEHLLVRAREITESFS